MRLVFLPPQFTFLYINTAKYNPLILASRSLLCHLILGNRVRILKALSEMATAGWSLWARGHSRPPSPSLADQRSVSCGPAIQDNNSTLLPCSSLTPDLLIPSHCGPLISEPYHKIMVVLSFKVNPEYAKITEIVPGLFICGVSALNRANMDAFDISLIINATTEVPNLRMLGEAQRIKLWLEDTPQSYIYPHLELMSDQIQATIADGGRVLVHCVAGVSRSASICLAFLTKHRCRSLRDAYHLMCSKRPMVRPNLGFWRQLIAYEQNVKQTAGSVRLVRDEAQPDKLLPDVYLKEVVPERPASPEQPFSEYDEGRERRNSGPRKFTPKLEPLIEIAEAAA
ncbi:hypothetical protein QR680_010032 [Steinernema hermaphroditum]|uniref:Protein-tyrosine-phosphatase n=1 Tax=Steinernema hermaphroditum TaxID=289476 RepID=A0AA39IP49_9BILA|nr:hypothetical protein QR680_010032 [Steinernema hermaphroditum]